MNVSSITTHSHLLYGVRGEMIDIDTYFKLNRITLLVLGLWPYHQTTLTRFHVALFSSILTSFVMFQFIGLLSAECESDLIIQTLCHMLFVMFYVVKYTSFWINIQTMKFMIDDLQCTWNELNDEGEIAILDKYGNMGKRISIVFICSGICICFIFLCLPYGLHVLQVFISINVSEIHITSYFMTENFLYEEKFSYLTLIYIYIVNFVGILTIAAVGSFFILYIEHGCGMFKIACYRIHVAIAAPIMDTVSQNKLENIMLIYRKLILAIQMHLKAIKFCEFLVLTMERSYFLYILILVSCLSLELYQIFETLLYGHEWFEVIVHFGGLCILLVYLFIFNYVGQQVTDHNNDIYLTAYNIQWYNAPLPIQKMILFVLQTGSKGFRLNIGGIFLLSMEFWASLMGTSLSYFTFMYNIQ